MPVTLAQAKLLTTDDVDTNVIDEFRKSSYMLDSLTFDDVVNPAGGGATLTYGYTRLATQPTAAFRAINAEYTPQEVTVTRHSVDLKPLGGSFQVDRVLAGIARGAEVSLQMAQKIKASVAFFNQSVILGDAAVDANSFDGLSKALAGTTSEYLPVNNGVATGFLDWTTVTDKARALQEMSRLDEALALMDGTPDAILGNRRSLARFKQIAAWADMLDKSTDAFGRGVTAYNGIPLIDLGDRAGTSTPVVPVETRDPDGAGVGGPVTNLTDLYAVRFGLDGFHGVSTSGAPLVRSWLPDFTVAGAVKTGEVEMGPVAVALKASKAACVLRHIKVA